MSSEAQGSSRWHTPTILQVLLAAVVIPANLILAAVLVFVALNPTANDDLPGAQLRLFLMSAVFLGLTFPALPSLYHSIRRLLGLPPAPQASRRDFIIASAGLLLFAAGLGLLLLTEPPHLVALLLFPLALLFVTFLPILWLVTLIRRGVPLPSLQRSWGTVNFTMFLTTPLIILIELIGLVFAVILVTLVVMQNPEWVAQIQALGEKLIASGGDVEQASELVLPWLTNPWVLAALALTIAVLTPLLEELLKPLALYFMRRQVLLLQQGFVLGALCGASFALVETLVSLTNVVGQPGSAGMAIGRTGTALIHITASAIMGRMIVQFREPGHGMRFLRAWLGASLLHGLWNLLALASGLLPSALSLAESPALNIIIPSVMALLAIACLLYLITQNRRMQDAPIPSGIPTGA